MKLNTNQYNLERSTSAYDSPSPMKPPHDVQQKHSG